MNHKTTLEQAQTMAALLPTLMRQLMAGVNDPAIELPLAQLRVCNILYQEPRPMSALSRELGVSLSAMTQIADRLERAGMVTRVAEKGDRRVRCLQLTVRGQQIIRSREAVRIERVMAVLERMSPATRKEVQAALKTLAEAADATKHKAAPVKNAARQSA